MNRDAPIGIFDSGIGGLTVLRHVRAALPQERLLYLADTRFVPYGEKGVEFIRRRSAEIVAELGSRGAKAVVVACNTATAAAVEHLRGRFELPVVAMEPALKPAAALTRSDVVAVLATAGTLGSTRYAELKDRHGRHVRVLEAACPSWVDLVERGELHSDRAGALVQAELEPVLAAGADVLVLGCTHFPFLEPLIRARTDPDIQIIDPAPAVARQLVRRLAAGDLLTTGSGGGGVRCLFTGPPPALDRLPVGDLCPSFTKIDL